MCVTISYVVLAADFEEAWKQVVKRTDDRPDFCASLFPPSLARAPLCAFPVREGI